MTTDADLKIYERIKDNPPGKRGIRREEIWVNEVTAPLPASWVNTDRPGTTVVLAQVLKGITKSWWEPTPDGFEECHQRVPCRIARRLKLVTLSADNEVTGVDFVSGDGWSLADFYVVLAAGAVSDGEPQSDYW